MERARISVEELKNQVSMFEEMAMVVVERTKNLKCKKIEPIEMETKTIKARVDMKGRTLLFDAGLVLNMKPDTQEIRGHVIDYFEERGYELLGKDERYFEATFEKKIN